MKKHQTYAIVRFGMDEDGTAICGNYPTDQKVSFPTIFGPYRTKTMAEKALATIGAERGNFPEVSYPGDHTREYSEDAGWTRTARVEGCPDEVVCYAVLPMGVASPQALS